MEHSPINEKYKNHLVDNENPDLHISYQITIAANLMAFGNSSRNIKKFGLNVGEWRILGCLGQMGPLTAAQIVMETHQDKANVSRSVKSLIRARLITKIDNPRHKNSPSLWLTYLGKDVYDRVMPEFTEQASLFTSTLSNSEKLELCKILDKLVHGIEKIGGAGRS